MIRIRHAVLSIAVAIFVAGTSAHAELPLPLARSPEEVGLSSVQLGRLEAVTRAHVESGVVPGAVMLVARRGKIAWYKTMGFRDRSANDPMQPDSIFRLYSMTKPVTSVAAMMLVEEGRLQISDPVGKYLPEIDAMKVGIEKPGADGKPTLELAAPARRMTVQDLLRHTSGLTYHEFGNSAVHTLLREAKVGDRSASTAAMVTTLSKLPLRFSPGARFEYGRSTDVLGRMIEVIEGKPLSEVLAARILRPLGMVDTAFQVPGDKLKRAVQAYNRPNGPPPAQFFDVAEKPAFEGGGEGLIGTTEDYLRFALMMLKGGTLNGTRLLGSQTVAFMTSDHLGAIPGFAPGQGFGLGYAVRLRTGEAALPGSVGEYGWGGYAGTVFWVDPAKEMIVLFMAHVNPAERTMLRDQFRSMVQAALID